MLEVKESKFTYDFFFNGYRKIFVSKDKFFKFLVCLEQELTFTDGQKTITFSKEPGATVMNNTLNNKAFSIKLFDSEKTELYNWLKSHDPLI